MQATVIGVNHLQGAHCAAPYCADSLHEAVAALVVQDPRMAHSLAYSMGRPKACVKKASETMGQLYGVDAKVVRAAMAKAVEQQLQYWVMSQDGSAP